jgi:hypothetical protein
MKSTIFWDITPCSPLSVYRRFGGTYRLHLQGQKISSARNQPESRWQACFHARFSLNSFFTLKMEAICSSETSVDNELHGVISQKVALYISTYSTLNAYILCN